MRSLKIHLLALLLVYNVFSQTVVYDDLGRKLEFQRIPQKVVSLAPSITETLFFLGLGGNIVGVTRYCNFPPEAQGKSIVGGVIDPNYEVIVSLKPELVIMTVEGNTREAFDKLLEIGIKVFVTNPRDFEGIFKTIKDFGKIFGVEARADHLIDSLKSEIGSIEKKNRFEKKLRVLVLLSLNPLITAGKNTFINEIIERAGGINIGGRLKQNYPVLNREEILKVNPDIIILTEPNIEVKDLLKVFPEWKFVNAVKKGMIYKIDPDIVMRPSPRVILATKIVSEIISKSSKIK